jgi:hypothetical protein
MRIAIENVSSAVKPTDLRKVIVALNKQLVDFGKFWNISASCQVGASSSADATIYLMKDLTDDGYLGYHSVTAEGRPYGVVLTALSERLGEPWSVTLSHEVLELAVDPEANRYAIGTHPSEDRNVFYWYEVCDAVQAEDYVQNGVRVSNFVLPLYFTPIDEVGSLSKSDFMRITGRKGGTLSSLWLTSGGYAGYYDPVTGTDDTVFADKLSKERYQIRQGAGKDRRAAKYRGRVHGGLHHVAGPQKVGTTEALRYVKDVEVIVEKLRLALASGATEVDISGLELPSFKP